MNKLRKKLNKQGGFTLVEMLIVVAIIAILIAISIPLINATLERAREGVDNANERSAVSLAYAYYLTTTDETSLATIKGTGLTLYYVIDSTGSEDDDNKSSNTVNEGNLLTKDEAKDAGAKAYGKGRADLGDVNADRRNCIVVVTIKDDGTTDNVVTVDWDTPPS